MVFKQLPLPSLSVHVNNSSSRIMLPTSVPMNTILDKGLRSPAYAEPLYANEDSCDISLPNIKGQSVRFKLHIPKVCRPRLLNVYTESAQHHSEAFADRFGLYTGQRFVGLQQYLFAYLCGFSYCTPTFQNEDVLHLIADYMTAIFAQDDRIDSKDSNLSSDLEKLAYKNNRLVMIMKGETLEGELSLKERAFLCIRNRLVMVVDDPSQLDVFAQTFDDWLASTLWEVENRKKSAMPDLESYRAQRRLTGAAYTVFALGAAIIGVPSIYSSKTPAHLSIRNIVDMACDCICIVNDMFSLRKELEDYPNENIVYLLAKKNKQGYQDAYNRANGEYEAKMESIYNFLRLLPDDLPEKEKEYVVLVLNWVFGNILWSQTTGRYREDRTHNFTAYRDYLMDYHQPTVSPRLHRSQSDSPRKPLSPRNGRLFSVRSSSQESSDSTCSEHESVDKSSPRDGDAVPIAAWLKTSVSSFSLNRIANGEPNILADVEHSRDPFKWMIHFLPNAKHPDTFDPIVMARDAMRRFPDIRLFRLTLIRELTAEYSHQMSYKDQPNKDLLDEALSLHPPTAEPYVLASRHIYRTNWQLAESYLNTALAKIGPDPQLIEDAVDFYDRCLTDPGVQYDRLHLLEQKRDHLVTLAHYRPECYDELMDVTYQLVQEYFYVQRFERVLESLHSLEPLDSDRYHQHPKKRLIEAQALAIQSVSQRFQDMDVMEAALKKIGDFCDVWPSIQQNDELDLTYMQLFLMTVQARYPEVIDHFLDGVAILEDRARYVVQFKALSHL